MTRKEGILLFSRTLVVYLILWALTDFSYVPQVVFSFVHWSRQTASSGSAYYRRLDLISLILHATRIVGFFILARWFHKCGPAVESLLLPNQSQEAEGSSQN